MVEVLGDPSWVDLLNLADCHWILHELIESACRFGNDFVFDDLVGTGQTCDDPVDVFHEAHGNQLVRQLIIIFVNELWKA